MLGILTVILSAFILTLHNLTVRVLFSEHLILGLFLVGGYVKPDLPNSFLLIFMRMLVVVPAFAFIIFKLYPSVWNELKELFRREKRDVFVQAIGCGVLMFIYIAILYLAIGLIPTGIAITLFFTYPIFTSLLYWKFFGHRPTPFRWLIMSLVLGGIFLTIPQDFPKDTNHSMSIGILASISSGIVYAFYNIIAQKCLEKCHPVPFTWISFAITLIISGACLPFSLSPTTQIDWTPIWIGSILSGIFSFAGHSLNNLGIRMINATTTSIIGSISPALTALIAGLALSETLSTIQMVGIGIVTLGIGLLSAEKVIC